MSKKYYRFFGGFLKKQEKWLNEMAGKGYRLVRTGIAWYEFEECQPGEYCYAVEFIGEKSKQKSREYASFLEDCGYRVLFKNLNLDYSVGKAVFRPWAQKGGKIATTGGTYNRELLLVEKENDGKPFELHTTEEDIREYRKTVRKPWLCSFAVILLLSLLALTGGFGSTRSAVRIGYVGSEGWSNWSGRYASLSGTMKKTIHPKEDVLHIEAKTNSGAISIEIWDADGNIVFDERDIGTASFDIDVSTKLVVKITAEKHSGSFLIE